MFTNDNVKEMFQEERFTEKELEGFGRGRRIDSRLHENVSYQVIDGVIHLINKR